MSRYSNSNLIWGTNSPLMALTSLALIVIASGRLSFALITLFLLVCIYAFSLSVIQLAKSYIPVKFKTAIVIMIAVFAASISYFFLSLINPVSGLMFNFMVFLIPLSFLSSNIVKRVEKFMPGESILQGVKEALALGIILVAISLIREPLGYGTLSFPFQENMVNLFPDGTRERLTLRGFTISAGVFFLIACMIAIIRVASHQKMEKDNNDE